MPIETTYSFGVFWDWDNDGFGGGDDDITAYVREIHTQRGFSTDPLTRIAEVGTCRLVINNISRDFSPDYTGGSFYGRQWINAPIRITEGTGIFQRTLWQGYVRSVMPEPGIYGGKTCIVQCEDIFGLYARSQLAIAAENTLTMEQALNLIGSEVFKTARATGTITFTDGGDEDDQITVGERIYTLKTSVSTTEYEVLIGADETETARNLAAAINDDPDAAAGVQIYGDNTYKSPQVSAEVSAGEITLTALNRGTLGNSIGLSLSAPHKDADSVTEVADDGTSGTVEDTYTANSVYYQVEELGGMNPGFDFYFDFTITGTGASVYILGRYSGGAGHTVRVQAYDWVGTAYDNLGTIPEAGSDTEYTFTLSAVHTDGSGNVRIRILHDDIGNATHFIRIDHMNVVADVSQTPLDITVSGSTLSGGADGPNGLTDYDTGLRTFDVIGDMWSEKRTNALRALSDVVESEFGLAWVDKSGKIVTHDHAWEFVLPSVKTGTGGSDTAVMVPGEMGQYIYNRVTVNYQPRGTSDARVIARANNVLSIPGKTEGTRWNREVGYPSSEEADALPGATKIVRLPFVDTDNTGNIVGARDVISPRRVTDFRVNDSRDLLGYDYTEYLPPFVRVSIAVTGSGVECTFSNVALDVLYISEFQVRGLAIIMFDAQQIIREDSTSIDTYQRQGLTYTLPLTSGVNFAEQIAIYLVRRYKDPRYRLNTMVIRDAKLDSVTMGIDIGDAFSYSEYQTGISHDYYIRSVQMDVTGMAFPEDANVSFTYHIKRIDDLTYWIINDPTYGIVGETTRPAL